MSDSSNSIFGAIVILIGIIIFIWPQLVGYLAGIFLVIYGAKKILDSN